MSDKQFFFSIQWVVITFYGKHGRVSSDAIIENPTTCRNSSSSNDGDRNGCCKW